MKTSKARGFNTARDWYHECVLLHVLKSLEKRNFAASYFQTIDAMNKNLLKIIPRSATVGVGGSVTIRELGILEKLEKRGNTVFHHWKKGLTETTDREMRIQEGQADYYLTSANAITLDGDIINIDGIGNRVAAMIYGPQNVIITVGYNKIVSSIDDGMRRSKDIAAVMNAKRIDAKTPCATTGICVDCNAKHRICRVTTIIQYRPWQTNISVMLVNKELGF
ncbi:MAG: lactate utilization protein [candidate division WOR-3 bacterium]|nr:MAG: lactate utilization protein [candidate division WOR-3 bacterium]